MASPVSTRRTGSRYRVRIRWIAFPPCTSLGDDLDYGLATTLSRTATACSIILQPSKPSLLIETTIALLNGVNKDC